MTTNPLPDYHEQHEEALRLGLHTYIDRKTGFQVWTAKYHLDRGACCESACRHCPYGYGK